MSLDLIYITNQPTVALIAEQNGVDRIMVDLEVLGKEERQKNLNSVKSHHTVADIRAVAEVLNKAQLLVRINPWHENSMEEIEQVISAGAQSIMLPMWKTEAEADAFLKTVNQRTRTVLLHNGCAAMARITGSGCMLTTLIGAFCAAAPERPFDATCAAMAAMGICGEIAEEKRLQNKTGNASFRTDLIDAVFNLTEQDMKERIRYEIYEG